MRSLLQWDSVLTSQLRFGAGEWNGDTLVISGGSERNAWFAGVGMDSLTYGPGLQVVFDGGLIAGVYPSAPTPESGAEFEDKFGAFMTWAAAYEPETVAGLLPEGLFQYNRDAAVDWLALLERYERSLAAPPP